MHGAHDVPFLSDLSLCYNCSIKCPVSNLDYSTTTVYHDTQILGTKTRQLWSPIFLHWEIPKYSSPYLAVAWREALYFRLISLPIHQAPHSFDLCLLDVPETNISPQVSTQGFTSTNQNHLLPIIATRPGLFKFLLSANQSRPLPRTRMTRWLPRVATNRSKRDEGPERR